LQPKRSRTIRVLTITAVSALVLAIGFLALRAFQGHLPTDVELAQQIERLETTVLPVVEGLQVEYFMDEPECANLTYQRGDFIDGDPDSCGGSTSRPVPFDEIARADHERIKAALEASQTPIERIGGRFASDGRIGSVWFMSNHGAPFATTWSLEYDPEGSRSAGTLGMVTVTPVQGEDDWWFACCSD
jgi:hypothetical protein